MEWKKIKDYENYSISKNGSVRNDKTGRILKPCYNHTGYQVVKLYKNGKGKIFKVHSLVAEAFIPNIDNKPCVDHINTIRDDNRIENLKWCTYKENFNNPLTVNNYSEANKGKRLSEEHKQKISGSHRGENNSRCKKIILLNTMEIFDYIKQASEKYKIDNSNITKCCRGRLKFAGKDKNGEKLVWMYLEDYESLK